MTLRHELAQRAILGALSGALLTLPISAIGWIILGQPPTIRTTVVVAEAISLAIYIGIRIHRVHETRTLQKAYDQPAYGEGGTK